MPYWSDSAIWAAFCFALWVLLAHSALGIVFALCVTVPYSVTLLHEMREYRKRSLRKNGVILNSSS
jgi:hypothetical protein